MSPLLQYRQLGTFSLPYELINGDPKQAMAILHKCLVFGCIRDNEWCHVSYLAANGLFDTIEVGEAIPYYNYLLEFKDGGYHRKWVRGETPARITLPT